MKCSLVYQAGIFFSTSIFCEKLILADKSRLKKFMVCRKSPLKKLTTLSAFTPASMSRQIKQPAARFEKGVWMNTVTTSYKAQRGAGVYPQRVLWRDPPDGPAV